MAFQYTSKEAWLTKTEADLKGKSLSDLNWILTDAISQSPLTHQEDITHSDLKPLTEGRKNNAWNIGEDIHISQNEKQANVDALAALEGGATAITFHHDDKVDLAQLLKDINLEWINTYFIGEADIINDFIKVSEKDKNQNLQLVNCGFYNTKLENIKQYVNKLPLATFHLIEVEENQDIAIEVAAIAIDYLRLAEELSEEDTDILNTISIDIKLTDQFLVNISKIRACKLVLHQIIEALKINVSLPKIRGSVAASSIVADEDYNKIKMMPHALSGIIGGVQELYLPPSSADAGKAVFHRRISRNINHLLEQESYMGRVLDPSAGSYYIESLTDKIANKAWTIIQKNQTQAG